MPDYYGTVQGFRDYHAARRGEQSAAYTFSDAKVEPALLVASEWLDAAIHAILVGRSFKLQASEQLREFPRLGLIDAYGYAVSHESVPARIEHATYELAWRECQDQGSLTRDHTPPKYRSVSVDGAVSVQYNNASAGELQTQYPIVWQILAPLLGSATNINTISGRVVRA